MPETLKTLKVAFARNRMSGKNRRGVAEWLVKDIKGRCTPLPHFTRGTTWPKQGKTQMSLEADGSAMDRKMGCDGVMMGNVASGSLGYELVNVLPDPESPGQRGTFRPPHKFSELETDHDHATWKKKQDLFKLHSGKL
jgi:hypothetical protein